MKSRELEGSEHGAGHPSIPASSGSSLELCLLVKGDYLVLEMNTSVRFPLLRGGDHDV